MKPALVWMPTPIGIMRLLIMSDLHLEFGPIKLPRLDADMVVLAGDVHVGTKGLEWIKKQFNDRPVIYVLGNHEFYHQSLPELTETVKQKTDGSNIHFLENSVVELHGFTFLGCTLWTDFALRSTPEKSMADAEALMNDFRIIHHGPLQQQFRAADAAGLHHESVAWLKNEMGKHDPSRTIVVTHHAPSPQSEAPYHVTSPLSPAFVSNLDAVIESSGIPMWVHGHTHHNVDYRLGSTRVLSNQRGYPMQPCKGFDPGLVVELP